MLVVHKIALDPNDKQSTYFARASGVARFAYNWALAEWKRQYEAGEKPSEAALRRRLNEIKREQFPWMLEVTKVAPQKAIKYLGVAFKRFFSGQSRYPTFKKKGVHDSFRADNGPPEKGADAVKVVGRTIKLPVVGWVRMREELRFIGQIKSAVVSKTADRWFVSIAVDIKNKEHGQQRENQVAVGVDLGIDALATLSSGIKVPGPKPRRALLTRLRRLSRSMSRKKRGSTNRMKARRRLARMHARIRCIRQDALHKLTTSLTRQYSLIGIETLNVRGMMSNHCLAGAISDMGFHEFKRQLDYKANWSGGTVVQAPQWFPSSKTCSTCDTLQGAMPLSVRSWTCSVCHTEHDRDINAAVNLLKFATASSAGCKACGEEGSGRQDALAVKPASVKQELSVKHTYGYV